MRQKSQKTDKNQGGEQKTQWDSNSGEGSAEGGLGRGDGGNFWDPTYSEHIYNRKDEGVGHGCGGGGQGGLVWEVGLVRGWGSSA